MPGKRGSVLLGQIVGHLVYRIAQVGLLGRRVAVVDDRQGEDYGAHKVQEGKLHTPYRVGDQGHGDRDEPGQEACEPKDVGPAASEQGRYVKVKRREALRNQVE